MSTSRSVNSMSAGYAWWVDTGSRCSQVSQTSVAGSLGCVHIVPGHDEQRPRRDQPSVNVGYG